MIIHKTILSLIFVITIFSCHNPDKKAPQTASNTSVKIDTLNKVEIILTETINAHGGHLYDSAHYSFVFRNNNYEFKNAKGNYEYNKIIKNEDIITHDKLKNGTFSRLINNKPVTLNDKDKNNASGAINSVIYFATLPHKLKDKAVKATYVGETIIDSKTYYILDISFKKEGGGVDFEDEFYYWVNTETKKIDYLAYNYRVNNGGVRFRSAYNVRVIDGITFQDYINYEAKTDTPLNDLPALYESGKLKELSKIETKHIINLKTKKE